MPIQVSSYDCPFEYVALIQKVQSTTRRAVYVVDGQFVAAIPQCDFMGVCGMPVEELYLCLDVTPYVSYDSPAALALAGVRSVPSDVDVARRM